METIPQVDLTPFDLHGGICPVKKIIRAVTCSFTEMKTEHFKIQLLELDSVSQGVLLSFFQK